LFQGKTVRTFSARDYAQRPLGGREFTAHKICVNLDEPGLRLRHLNNYGVDVLPSESLRGGKTMKAGHEIVSGTVPANYDRLDHPDLGHRLYKLLDIRLVRGGESDSEAR
jgi:hypothetical protein